jgi:small subunit ribosomal protein S17
MATEKKPFTHTVRGIVVKLSTEQTIRVAVKRTKVHPIYKKRYVRTTHFLVHDENNVAKVGDTVTIAACRPVSKNKQWRVVEA